jgi:hypothetical protein
MAQRQIDLEMPTDSVEHGYTICRDRHGNFAKGPETRGTHNRVDIDVRCPAGFTPDALWHSHPGGTTEPSPADCRAAKKNRLGHLCISVPETGETVCHEVCKRCQG